MTDPEQRHDWTTLSGNLRAQAPTRDEFEDRLRIIDPDLNFYLLVDPLKVDNKPVPGLMALIGNVYTAMRAAVQDYDTNGRTLSSAAVDHYPELCQWNDLQNADFFQRNPLLQQVVQAWNAARARALARTELDRILTAAQQDDAGEDADV